MRPHAVRVEAGLATDHRLLSLSLYHQPIEQEMSVLKLAGETMSGSAQLLLRHQEERLVRCARVASAVERQNRLCPQ